MEASMCILTSGPYNQQTMFSTPPWFSSQPKLFATSWLARATPGQTCHEAKHAFGYMQVLDDISEESMSEKGDDAPSNEEALHAIVNMQHNMSSEVSYI
jgi:hypothetical protein